MVQHRPKQHHMKKNEHLNKIRKQIPKETKELAEKAHLLADNQKKFSFYIQLLPEESEMDYYRRTHPMEGIK
jgi:hypothetical protein